MKKNIFIPIIIIVILISTFIIIFINNNNKENQTKEEETKNIESSDIANNDMIKKLTDKYSLIKDEKMRAEGTKKNYIVYDSTKGLWESTARENAIYNKYKEIIKARNLKTYTGEDAEASIAIQYYNGSKIYFPCYSYLGMKRDGLMNYGVLKSAVNQNDISTSNHSPYDFDVAFQISTTYELEDFNEKLGPWKHEDGLKKALELHKKTFEELTKDNIIEEKITMGDVKQYEFYQGAKFEGYYILKDKYSEKTNKIDVVGVIIEGSEAPNIIAFYDGRQEGEKLINYYKNQLDNVLDLYWEPDVWLGKTEVYWK